MIQEVEERLKQTIQPLSADLSLPPGLEKKLKGGQQGGGYGGSKEASSYTKVSLTQPASGLEGLPRPYVLS